MKRSRYNIFAETDAGSHLVFNSATAALAEIEPEQYQTVMALLDGKEASTAAEQELLGSLARGRYLVPDEVDELLQLKVRNRIKRFGGSTLSLTIAPTLACNFGCSYCFEQQQAVHMDQATVEATLQLAEVYLARAEVLQVTWFGGEPTLRLPTIVAVQQALRERCAEHGVALSMATIISNGYLLDGEMATTLRANGVTTAQVTLDGPPAVHDRRRPLRGGGATFQRIISNLHETADMLDIGIRVNVDQDNPNAALEVPLLLAEQGLLEKVRLSFAPVNAATTACADLRAKCYTDEEFAQLEVELYRQLVERGFTEIGYPAPLAGGLCAADSLTSFVVAPDGTLFKCWEQLSASQAGSVGSVHAETRERLQEAKLDTYLGWDPFVRPGCRQCNILPLCMGGCPHQGLLQERLDRGVCVSWRHNLPEMLLLRHRCAQRKG